MSFPGGNIHRRIGPLGRSPFDADGVDPSAPRILTTTPAAACGISLAVDRKQTRFSRAELLSLLRRDVNKSVNKRPEACDFESGALFARESQLTIARRPCGGLAIDMANREFTTPVPRIADVRSATSEWERIALKWRNIAERRRDQHFDLYKTGRWKRYYTGEKFLAEMRQAVALAERWAAIAPLPEEREPAADAVQPRAA